MPLKFNRSGDISIWEIPEIDGVKKSLETHTWDDDTSDDWSRLIDYATDPRPMTDGRALRVHRLMRRFEEKSDYMQVTLETGADDFNTPNLLQHYESALDQVAELTGIDRSSLIEV